MKEERNGRKEVLPTAQNGLPVAKLLRGHCPRRCTRGGKGTYGGGGEGNEGREEACTLGIRTSDEAAESECRKSDSDETKHGGWRSLGADREMKKREGSETSFATDAEQHFSAFNCAKETGDTMATNGARPHEVPHFGGGMSPICPRCLNSAVGANGTIGLSLALLFHHEPPSSTT